MIVQCPYCGTRYQLDDERFNAPNPMLKCSRCRHVFPAPSAKKPASAKAKKTSPPEDESLTLPFEKESWKEADDSPAERLGAPLGASVADEDDAQAGFVLGTGEEIEDAPAEDNQVETEDVEGGEELMRADEPPAEALPDLSFAEDDEPPDLTYSDDEELPPPAPPNRERFVVRGVLICLALIVAAYGLLTHSLFTDPALARRVLGPLPVIGTFASDRLLARDVTLVGVKGDFRRIKDGKEVFVVTGEAFSAAPMILHNVEIRGRLLGAGGEVVAEKIIYCGNVVSAKILNELTPGEVSLLQKVAPPKEFGIKPGGSAAFVIVFMDPPKTAVELSTQVIGAAA